MKRQAQISRKISLLMREGYPQDQAIAIAMKRRKTNPGNDVRDDEDSAEDIAAGFHGREVLESFDIEEEEQYRENLAELGILEELEVLNVKVWEKTEELKVFSFETKGKNAVRLAGSSDRKQLFLVGGDQEISDDTVENLAGSRAADKDKVSLGYVYSISYKTDKHHLEGSNGRVESYMHCFGENSFENPDARQDGQADYLIYAPLEKLEAGLLPELIYNRLNGTMELVGGGYVIKDEGIWD